MSARIKLTSNFYLDEFIPKSLYLKYEKTPWILIGLIDKELVLAYQKIRDKFGSITINNWWDGQDRQWSGLRLPESPDYSPTSQHTFGRAGDGLPKDHTVEEIHIYLKEHWQEVGVTAIEDVTGWLHLDTRLILNQTSLLIVPKK